MPQAVATWAVTALGATGYTATAVYAAAYIGTAYAISYAASEILAPGANKTAAASGAVGGAASVSNAEGVVGGSAMSTTVRQSAAARRLIYGTVKTGGVLVYAKKTPDEFELHQMIYLGEGPIEGIDSAVYLGESLSTDAAYSGLVDLEVFTGAAGQTHSASLAAVSEGEWDSYMVGRGCALAHTTYTFDKDRWDLGPVAPAFLVRGRLCYDPRTAATLTTATSNPALVVLDFIRSEYGYRLADERIDFDSFAIAANICDQMVASVDAENTVLGVPNLVRRYSLNGVFETDVGPAKTIAAMLQCCAGTLVRVGGVWKLYVGAYRAPTGPQLTEVYLRDAVTYRAHQTRTARYNIARGTYREPKQDWQDTTLADQVLSAAIVAEDGEIVQSVDLPAVTNGAQAQRLARLYMMLARSAVPTILRCNFAAMQWAAYDVVDVYLPQAGIDGTFMITKITYVPLSEGGGIDLNLVPHNASDYAWDHTTMETVVEEVVVPNMDFPAPGIGTVTGLVTTEFFTGSDQVRRTVKLLWDEPDWAIISYYEVQIKESGGDWQTFQSAETYWSFDASPDKSYQARVRVVGLNDKAGAYSSTFSITVYRDPTAPGAPSGVGVDGEYTARVYWTAPSSSNYGGMRVYTVSGPGLGSATYRHTVPGRPGAAGEATYAFPPGTHYAIAPESVDGVEGSMVYAGQGINTLVSELQTALDDANTTITNLNDRVTTLESA